MHHADVMGKYDGRFSDPDHPDHRSGIHPAGMQFGLRITVRILTISFIGLVDERNRIRMCHTLYPG